MAVEKRIVEGGCVLLPEERLDTLTSQTFLPELLQAIDEHKNVTLDFEKLDYISSAGLRVLIMGAKKAKAAGGEQHIINTRAEVYNIISMTGLESVLNPQRSG